MNKLMTVAPSLWLALTAGALLAAPSAAPSLQPGTIIGHVRDTAGRPLAGIPVKITQTGEFVLTDKDGGYLFVREAPGAYSLSADGQVTPLVATRTQVTLYSRVVLSFTLAPAGHDVFDFILRPIGAKWVVPQPYPILREYSGPGTARQPPPEDALGDNLIGGDSGLHSTARSR